MFHFEIPVSPTVLVVHLPQQQPTYANSDQTDTMVASMMVEIQVGDNYPPAK